MNQRFEEFKVMKHDYYQGDKTKSKKEEIQAVVTKLISDGWATETMKIVYDFGIEKYRTIGLNSLTYTVYEKDKTIRVLLKQTYTEFLPKNALDYVCGKNLVFEPHEPLDYELDGMPYSNLFIKSRFLSYSPPRGKRIASIDWNKYRAISALFDNVFKTKDRKDFFINWLAYGFQTLKKSRTAIVSKGIQGTGKGVIFERIIQYAIGANYTTVLENEALKSRFNGELENKLFVLANEIKADHREGNNTYERLKMYIADTELRFEDKNIKARTIPNYFNMWFHSNHDVPLQIQGSDRRYTVFNTKSKKLTTVSDELGYEFISEFLKDVDLERDDFIYDIMSLKYDEVKATTPLTTEEKELIYEASMNKIDILSDKLKKKDLEWLADGVYDLYESSDINDETREIKREFDTPTAFIAELSKQLKGNYLTNGMGQFLYKIFVNETAKDRKIGLQLNSKLGKATLKNLNGNRFKYRKIDNDKDVTFVDNVDIQYEDKNGNIEQVVTLSIKGRNIPSIDRELF